MPKSKIGSSIRKNLGLIEDKEVKEEFIVMGIKRTEDNKYVFVKYKIQDGKIVETLKESHPRKKTLAVEEFRIAVPFYTSKEI